MDLCGIERIFSCNHNLQLNKLCHSSTSSRAKCGKASRFRTVGGCMKMQGFDCQFTVKPVDYLQSHCPICLLILREPFQVTCCGNSFCRACIQQIGAGNKPCPTCNQDNFDSFQNKGLQQPLYGFQVSCSNKESGCDWQGELGKLDQHLNKDKLSVGCAYMNVKCLFCDELYQRSKIEHHQGSQCTERPFTCSWCEEYYSTYNDVITNHAPVCKCRPVKCPNSCGAKNLQHQHLEEHVSTQCPLSYVDCEFSDAGCDVKVHKKDLTSHMEENMVTHMSLLARENRKLKLQHKVQEEKNRQLEEKNRQLEEKIEEVKYRLTRVPPVYFECLDVWKLVSWTSEPFYSHVGGYKLQLELYYDSSFMSIPNHQNRCLFSCKYIKDKELSLPCKQLVTVLIIDQERGKHFKVEIVCKVDKYEVPCHGLSLVNRNTVNKLMKNNHLLLRIDKVENV